MNLIFSDIAKAMESIELNTYLLHLLSTMLLSEALIIYKYLLCSISSYTKILSPASNPVQLWNPSPHSLPFRASLISSLTCFKEDNVPLNTSLSPRKTFTSDERLITPVATLQPATLILDLP